MENPKRSVGFTLRVILTLIPLCLLQPRLAFACEAYTDELAGNNALRVGAIQINIEDVFNDALVSENLWIHKLANKLHITSKRELIASQLLFKTGEAFDADVLSETERNLRSNKYLRSATVTPIQVCENQVDIKVVTGDNWSLIPGFSFARAGGRNEYAFRLAELNLLGLGKSLDFEFIRTPEREQHVLRFNDPMLFGSKTQFTTQFQDNSDGEVQLVEFEQPFFSLDTQRAWRVNAINSDYIQNRYNAGQVIYQLFVERETASLEYGFSNGKQNINDVGGEKNRHQVFRWRAGWVYDRLFLADVQPTSSLGLGGSPIERIYSFPFIQMTYLQPEFIEQTNLQLMESIEDIAIGHRLRARLGWAAEAFRSHTDALVFETEYSKGWQPDKKVLGLLKTSATGFFENDRVEDGLAKFSLQGFYFATRKLRSFAEANIVSSTRLFQDNQVVLGGQTGLRGYPLRFQTGEHRARFTVEQRYFFDWYPLRLARVGAAAFADAGSAWRDGVDPKWLTDVGFGLRVVGTRQAGAKVMHIDFAFPLNETDQIDSFQLVVSAKTQF